MERNKCPPCIHPTTEMANHSKQQVVTPPLTNFPIITMEAKYQEVRQELGRTTILDIVNSTINNTGSSNHNQDPMDNQSLNKFGIILGPGPILGWSTSAAATASTA